MKRLQTIAVRVLLQMKKFRFLPHVMTPYAWRLFCALVCVALVSGGLLIARALDYTIVTLPKRGGSYTEVVVGTPSLVNPLFALANPVDQDLTRLLFSGLVRVNAALDIEPDLAEQYTMSPDKKTYTFRLRKDATWHDGKPVTADDIVFTFSSIQNPEMKSPLEPSFRGVTFTKVDDATVQLTLREPFAPFLEILTVGILPRHLWYDVPPQTASLAEYNIRPVGTGPFSFRSFVRDKKGVIKSYTLRAWNKHSWRLPYLQEIRFLFAPTINEAVTMVERGEADGIGALPSHIQALKEAVDADAKRLPLSQYTALFFNQQEHPSLKDAKVRQALAHALDREALIAEALDGNGTPLAGPIVLGALGYTTDIESYPFDVEKAKKLLTDAGWKEISSDNYRAWKQQRAEAERKKQEEVAKKEAELQKKKTSSTPDLREVEQKAKSASEVVGSMATPLADDEPLLPLYRKKDAAILSIQLTTIDQSENRRVAEVIKRSWEAIGVRVTLDIRKENFQKDVILPRQYEALLFGNVVGREPDPYAFWHSTQTEGTGGNLSLYADKKVDALLEDARQTNDAEVRAAKYKEFQTILTTALPAHFLYNPIYTYLLPPRMRGFSVSRISKPSDRFLNITDWYMKTRWAIERQPSPSSDIITPPAPLILRGE